MLQSFVLFRISISTKFYQFKVNTVEFIIILRTCCKVSFDLWYLYTLKFYQFKVNIVTFIIYCVHPEDFSFAFNMTKFAAMMRDRDTTKPVLFRKDVSLKRSRTFQNFLFSLVVAVDTSLTLLTDTVCWLLLCVM